jgi:hypothetical protein
MRTAKAASLPEAKVLVFDRSPGSHWYTCTHCPPGFNKVPNELTVEDTAKRDLIKSSQIIRSRKVNGKYPFFTGIRPTAFPGVYTGDHKGSKKNSFCLFVFSNSNERFTLYFFNSYYIVPGRIPAFVRAYLNR